LTTADRKTHKIAIMLFSVGLVIFALILVKTVQCSNKKTLNIFIQHQWNA